MTGAGRTRCARLLLAGTAVLAVAGGVLGIAARTSSHPPPVTVVSDRINNCRWSTSSADLHLLRSSVTEFGLDLLRLRAPSSRITVVEAELIKPRGNIRLTDVAFTPGGGAGNGFTWDDPRVGSGNPTAWPLRRTMPAVLSRPAAGRPDPVRMNLGWQIVVGVAVTGNGGGAAGVRVTYLDGIRVRHIDGQDGIGVWATESMCD